MDGWGIEEDIIGSRHCLEVAGCATDKTGDIRAREAVAWNKERYCWLGERPGWRSHVSVDNGTKCRTSRLLIKSV